MAYAQKNYLQVMGINGKYRIDQIGCFLTSMCELATEAGHPIDPIGLNNIFRDRQIYIDIDDRIRDDLNYDSISRVFPDIVVGKVVNHGINRTAGWPSTNKAIVRFYYKSINTGQMIFHFCKVADAGAQTIVDSWDGQVKKSPYGEPTGYAEYTTPTPQVITPVQPPANPLGKQLFLPAAAGTWRVYPLNKPAAVGNEVGRLAPGNFPPGLTYDILGQRSPTVFEIQTNSFGRVQIYAGPDTIAQFRDKPAEQPAPAPAPTPVVAPAAPVEPPKPPFDLKATARPLKAIFRAKESITVKDFETGVTSDLNAGNLVRSSQRFQDEAGIWYVRTIKSFNENKWFGIPEDNLLPAPDPDEPAKAKIEDIYKPEDDKEFDFSMEIKELRKNLNARQKIVSYVGSIAGLATKVFKVMFKRKKG